MTEKEEERLSEAILKVALGFQVAEVTEEYAEVDGELKLTKRKKTKKDVPPDLKAAQLLLGENGLTGIEKMSDEELNAEKERLFALLRSAEKGEGQVCVESKKVARKPRAKPRKKVTRSGKITEKSEQ
jgi:hypothetical protein